jgi:hypothetical protein
MTYPAIYFLPEFSRFSRQASFLVLTPSEKLIFIFTKFKMPANAANVGVWLVEKYFT